MALARESGMRLRASIAEAPAHVELRLARAAELVSGGRASEALALVDEAAAIAPRDFTVRLRRAECLASLGRYRESFMDLELARVLPAPDVRAIAYYGELHRWVAERMSMRNRLRR